VDGTSITAYHQVNLLEQRSKPFQRVTVNDPGAGADGSGNCRSGRPFIIVSQDRRIVDS
jgi:hypothetical protein